jgi:hypothetical protein
LSNVAEALDLVEMGMQRIANELAGPREPRQLSDFARAIRRKLRDNLEEARLAGSGGRVACGPRLTALGAAFRRRLRNVRTGAAADEAPSTHHIPEADRHRGVRSSGPSVADLALFDYDAGGGP